MLEVCYAADLLGIDVVATPNLAWIAEEALALELPLGWEVIVKPGKGKSADDSLNPCYYHNALLGLTQWQHPHLTYLMALAAELGGEKKGGGRPPAARDVFGE